MQQDFTKPHELLKSLTCLPDNVGGNKGPFSSTAQTIHSIKQVVSAYPTNPLIDLVDHQVFRCFCLNKIFGKHLPNPE